MAAGATVAAYVAGNHADAELIERHGDSLSYSESRLHAASVYELDLLEVLSAEMPVVPELKRAGVPRESTCLADLFRDMEGDGRARGVTEYSISQTTLEQVFLRIAKKQRDDEEAARHA